MVKTESQVRKELYQSFKSLFPTDKVFMYTKGSLLDISKAELPFFILDVQSHTLDDILPASEILWVVDIFHDKYHITEILSAIDIITQKYHGKSGKLDTMDVLFSRRIGVDIEVDEVENVARGNLRFETKIKL